ncbi:MAG: methionine--tRNA ligase [Bdellovibrionales bacterium]|nr:methionine--tRNA ligase [Bdellovibrionales bacterium]
MKRHLITSALPYANGPIHLGHLAGAYLPADIYTRHHRLLGHNVLHISGSDEHGVAIMLNAQKAGKEYKEYVDQWHLEHKKTFEKFQVDFDFFGQTSADYHTDEVNLWFKAIYDKGLIEPKESDQLQCQSCKNHLPDRFVEGVCYSCGYEHARGDECPSCGIIIDPVRLKSPICKICGSREITEVKVTQWYLALSKFHKEFREWFETKSNDWRKTVYPFVDSLTKEGLHDRAITRDLDWGIDVPLDEAKGKKLYVWFDAPIGYVSNTKECLKKKGEGEDYIEDWWKNPDTEITHFLAKDNIIFHTIIFPCMMMSSERAHPPTDVPANQYLNLAGKQFSKSQGWYVDLDQAYDQFGPSALRYYLISILPEFDDASFTWEDFQAKVNGELANNIGSLVNRCLKFFAKNWNEGISRESFESFFQRPECSKFSTLIKEHLELVDDKTFKKGLEKVMYIGQQVNTFFSDEAPWASIKEDPAKAAETIAHTTMLISVLAVLLSPYLPELSENILKHYPNGFDHENRKRIYSGDLDVLIDIFGNGYKIQGKPSALVPKIDDSVIKELVEGLNAKGV